MSRPNHQLIEHVGNALANELFDACAMVKSLQHQTRAIEDDEVATLSEDAHDAGRVLLQVYGRVSSLASQLADCEVAPHPSQLQQLRALLGREGESQ